MASYPDTKTADRESARQLAAQEERKAAAEWAKMQAAQAKIRAGFPVKITTPAGPGR
jgi:hypothetical protein